MIHAFWSEGDEPSVFASNIKARSKLNFDIRHMSGAEINRIANDIFTVVIELAGLATELSKMGYHHPHDA